jgi:group II intron reverse transcriptase/maturase
VTQALERVRKAARQRKKERFTALFHHITIDLLRLSFFALKRDAAPGADGVTWQDYEADLERKLGDLHARVHRGAYRPQPSRRRYIPKADGWQRPLAVAALEDKIVQRATAAVLNQIYEEDFLGFSYGFRPGRSQHDALDALMVGIRETMGVSWIIDADIQSFFDTVSHEWLIRFLEHRGGDRRIIRLIQKWLRAGVLEDGSVTVSETGTGQCSVISPLLANVCLHDVFDLWANRWRRREATGTMIITRYADDLVIGFERQADAHRFLQMMHKRFEEFALSLHPEKTRLIEFGRCAAHNRGQSALGKPETFHFLGDSRLKRKTRRDRSRAKLQEIKEGLRRRRHYPIPQQGQWLQQVVRGFFAYHAVPTNLPALVAFRRRVTEIWWRTLKRRGQREDHMAAGQGNRRSPAAQTENPAPVPGITVCRQTSKVGPYAGKPHVRFCAGGAQ